MKLVKIIGSILVAWSIPVHAIDYTYIVDNQTPFTLEMKFHDVGLLKSNLSLQANSKQTKKLLGDCIHRLHVKLPLGITFLNALHPDRWLSSLLQQQPSAFTPLNTLGQTTGSISIHEGIFAKKTSPTRYLLGMKHITVALSPDQTAQVTAEEDLETFCKQQTFSFGYYERTLNDAPLATWTKQTSISPSATRSDQMIFVCLGTLPEQLTFPVNLIHS
jgi:hypothetical protein